MDYIDFFNENVSQEDYVKSLLDRTPYNRIWLATDWHIYKDAYTKGKQSQLELKRLIIQQKAKVKPNDIFIYMGDTSYKKLSDDYDNLIRYFYNQLNGIKILIKGNHDFKDNDYYLSLGFNYVFDELQYKDIIFSHKPLMLKKYKKVKINVHGHIHGERVYMDSEKENHLDCWTDSHTPINLEELLKKKEQFDKENIDSFNKKDFDRLLEHNKKDVQKYKHYIKLFFNRYPEYKNLSMKEMYDVNLEAIKKFVQMPEIARDEELIGWKQTKPSKSGSYKKLPYRPVSADKYEHTVVLNKDTNILIDPFSELVGRDNVYTVGDMMVNFHFDMCYGFGYINDDGEVELDEKPFPQTRFDEVIKQKGIKLHEDYEPPMNLKDIKKNYGNDIYLKLKNDPVHKWRAETGIELIHKEPSKEELERVMKNWDSMDDRRKRLSDQKSMELFGKNNRDNYNELINTYNESLVIPEKNFAINVDQWREGNPLWITGSSGDGKSTYSMKLGEEYDAYVSHLDLFLLRITRPKEKYEKLLSRLINIRGTGIILDYINQHPELPWQIRYDSSEADKLWIKFFDWLLDNTKNNPKYRSKKFIFEGCNICLMSPEKAVTLPLIIMGTSDLQASIRRIKRDRPDGRPLIEDIFREIKRSRDYIKDLNKQKYDFKRSVRRALHETINSPIKVYHASKNYYKELKSVGLDFGNVFQEEGFSLFTWTKYNSAIGWGCFEVLKTLKKVDSNITHMGCKNSQNPIITKSVFNYLKDNLNNYDKKLLEFYIYTIKLDSDMELGLGHSSNTPNCITIRKDSIKYAKVDKFIMTIDMIKKHCIIVDDKYQPTTKDFGVNGRFMTPFMTKDYMYQTSVKKQLNNDLKSGKLTPNDNLHDYLIDNNLELTKVRMKDRFL